MIGYSNIININLNQNQNLTDRENKINNLFLAFVNILMVTPFIMQKYKK